MRLKTFENYDDVNELGKLLLIYDDDIQTTWFYILDAIINGLFEETWQLDDETVEDIGIKCFDNNYMSQEDLYDEIIENFQGSLQKILDYLLEIDFLIEDTYPTIKIQGTDEDGEDWNFYYEASEKDKQKLEFKKSTKKYNL